MSKNVNRRRLILMLAGLAFSLSFVVRKSRGLWVGKAATSQTAAGIIAGTVFQDYNANGARDTVTNILNSGSGNTGWDAVGKNSLGGMVVSDDEKKLYVMNLADRQLYELPLDAAPVNSNIRSRSVPLTSPGCPNALDVRPFSVNFYGGQIYVGMVCSAESTVAQTTPDGDATKLQA